jgi:hypothetical protein
MQCESGDEGCYEEWPWMISLAESVSKCFHAFSRYQIDYLIAMLALFSLLRKRQTVLFCAMPCRAVFYEGV